MRTVQFRAFSYLIFFSVIFQTAMGLKCYDCALCNDPFEKDKARIADCGDGLCVKATFLSDLSAVKKGDVNRMCYASTDMKPGCNIVEQVGVQVEICLCNKDFCNGLADVTVPSSVPQDNTTTAAAPVQTRSDIECHPDSISVHLPQNLLPGGQNVTWREEACSVAFNVTHYTDTIQLTDCGTTVQLGDQTVIFSNDLIVHKAGSMSQHNSNADITFGDGYDSIIPVQCIYPRQNNLTSSYAPIKQHVRFMERRHGQLELSLEQYKTAQYKALIPSNGHPRSVPLNDDIYMRVGLTLPGKDLRVKVDQCIATSTPSPLDANWHHLINSSCPVSPTQLLSSSVSQDVKFSFKAFDFRHSSSGFIYIHCEVTVCSTTDPNCVMSCSKRTRRAASVNPFGGSHLLSAGPFQMAKEDVKEGAVSSAIVFASACLSLALISVGVAILGWTRKSRHSQTFEKL